MKNRSFKSNDDAHGGFYQYFAVSRREQDWGLYLTGTGMEVGMRGAPQELHPPPYMYAWSSGRRLLNEYGIVYFHSGTRWLVETEATKKQIEVAPNSVLLLFPGVWHRYRQLFTSADARSTSLWCLFGGDMAARWQSRQLISPQHPILPVGGAPIIEQGFNRLHNQVQMSGSFAFQQTLAAGVMELLASTLAASRATTAPSFPADLIRKARSVLENLAIPDASPERVADMLNQPYNAFRRAFKLATGLSPHQYRIQVIINRSKELLATSDLSIKEIASALHFPDQYYFAKIFKRKTSMTPTGWRSRSRVPNRL